MAGASQERRLKLRPWSRRIRSLTLLWALAASLVVHAALVVATLPGGRAGIAAMTPQTLEATLRPAQTPPPETPVIATPAPSVLTSTVAIASLPIAPPASVEPANPVAPAPKGPPHGLAAMEVLAQPLADKNRLGDFMARQMTEFPIEVDRPARLDENIVARYPAAALREGREDSVAVWIVVNAEGVAEEVQVLDGSQEFADEVLAAINAAKFLPGEDNLKPIRYPIALEFQFRTGATEATASTGIAQ
jgi:TonB family protein